MRTALVEAAPPTGLDALGDAFEITNSGRTAYPANRTRLIALGGTSNIWSGVVNRLRPSDFRVRSEFGMEIDNRQAEFFRLARSAREGTGGPVRVARSKIETLRSTSGATLKTGLQAMDLATAAGRTIDALVARYFVEHPTYLLRFRGDGRSTIPPGAFRTYTMNDRFRGRGLNACHFQVHLGFSGEVVCKAQPEMQP